MNRFNTWWAAQSRKKETNLRIIRRIFVFVVIFVALLYLILFGIRAWVIDQAMKGNPRAQYYLGVAYEAEGYNQAALRLYAAATLKNIPEAQERFAYFLLKGIGTAKNEKVALAVYEKMADKGNSSAQFRVGIAYMKGTILSKDINKGILYLKKAAGQNNKYAQAYLALVYSAGRDVPLDPTEARKWASLAKENGYENGEKLLISK